MELIGLLTQMTLEEGRRWPMGPDCPTIHEIIRLVDHPEQVPKEEMRHMLLCGRCKYRIQLFRRDRDIIEAPSEPATDQVSDDDSGKVDQEADRKFWQKEKEEKYLPDARNYLESARRYSQTNNVDEQVFAVRHYVKAGAVTLEELGTSEEELTALEQRGREHGTLFPELE